MAVVSAHFTRKAARTLRRACRVEVRLRIQATGSRGAVSAVDRALTLRRQDQSPVPWSSAPQGSRRPSSRRRGKTAVRCASSAVAPARRRAARACPCADPALGSVTGVTIRPRVRSGAGGGARSLVDPGPPILGDVRSPAADRRGAVRVVADAEGPGWPERLNPGASANSNSGVQLLRISAFPQAVLVTSRRLRAATCPRWESEPAAAPPRTCGPSTWPRCTWKSP